MLTLRPFRREDYEVVRRWADDPVALGPFAHPRPRALDDADVRRMVSGEPTGPIVRLGMELDGRLIGEAQYRSAPEVMPPGLFEIGIDIWDPADRGRGHGREAQRLLVELLFRERGAHRVQAGTDPSNEPERRCLQALGFREEGTLRGFFPGPELPDGTPGRGGDIVMYGLLREEWGGRAERDDEPRIETNTWI